MDMTSILILFAASSSLWAFSGGPELGEAVRAATGRIAQRQEALRSDPLLELSEEGDEEDGAILFAWEEEPRLVEPARLVEGDELQAAIARAEVRVDISLAAQKLTLKEGDAEPRVFTISSGKKGFRTPAGCFIVDQTMRMAYSSKYGGSPMPFSVFFKGGTKYATHGTSHLDQLGSPASHGCVRLHPDNARIVFETVRRHDPDNTKKNALFCIMR